MSSSCRTSARRRQRPLGPDCLLFDRSVSSTRATLAVGRSLIYTVTGRRCGLAPVVEDGAREREVALPRGTRIETVTGSARDRRRGGRRAGLRFTQIPVSGSAAGPSSSPTPPSTSQPDWRCLRIRTSAAPRRHCGGYPRPAARVPDSPTGRSCAGGEESGSVTPAREITFETRCSGEEATHPIVDAVSRSRAAGER